MLSPFAHRVVVIDRALVCLGVVSRVLGLLAGVLGDRLTAEKHLRAALAKHEAMGARPLGARTRVDLARLLRDDGRDTSEIAEHLTLARATASELGMPRVLAEAEASSR